MTYVQRRDDRKDQPVRRGADREVPRRVETGPERGRADVREAADDGPDRRLFRIDELAGGYDLRFPCSSYS